MERGKIVANRGVERNKKPLQNILYKVEVRPTPDGGETYILLWAYERDLRRYGSWSFHGEVSPEGLKSRLGERNWSKFRQGRREFVVQRRVDGRNVPKKRAS